MVNEANSPTAGSTPAITEKLMTSGISASATTSPASTSVHNRRGDIRNRPSSPPPPGGATGTGATRAGDSSEAEERAKGTARPVVLRRTTQPARDYGPAPRTHDRAPPREYRANTTTHPDDQSQPFRQWTARQAIDSPAGA
ncbi:hypothetical protein ScoT_38920 [Streptomyces albidoflavus]|uniref:Uncharacterized protein n=1 Tax=Streptomyces albidoflavus TaxID=1886 RepID=A0AA37FFZ8_9ACTN|nr:hypothetical protein ScoT_38920 [Streptomyces albidoflavus]